MEPFKNLLDAHAAARIAAALSRSWPGFPRSRFLADIEQALAPLELKQRMLLLASRLQDALPQAPVKSFGILCDAVQQDPDDEVGVSSFLVWPFTRYVAQNGLPHFDASMAALHRLTQAFTAEFDVRPFLVHHEARTLRQLAKWTEDDSEHVRRLVSEGSRPLLPWGERLPAFVAAPEKTWPLLEALRRDPSKYVQKSVANHLNDHTKHHGDWVVEGLRRWHGEARKPPSLDWIIRHGLRTLVKRGHPGALALLGVAGNDALDARSTLRTRAVALGESLQVDVTLRNTADAAVEVLVDCEIAFLKADGGHGPKVFKGRRLSLAANESRTLALGFPLRAVTTRRYYPGAHACTILVNGRRLKRHPFVLHTG